MSKVRVEPYQPGIGQRFKNAGVEPGAHPEREKGPQIANPFKMFADRFMRKMKPSAIEGDDAEARYKGQKAYWDAKYERLTKGKTK